MNFKFFLSFCLIVSFLIFPKDSSSQELKYERGWFGNTFSGWKNWEDNGVPINVQDIFVAKDGVVYTASPWGENTPEIVGWDQEGNMIQSININGWRGTKAVVADELYMYADFENDIRKVARNAFDLRRNQDLKAEAIANEVGEVTSLTIIGDELFASIEGEGVVVFSTKDLTRKRKLDIVDPHKISSDNHGNLWVLTGRSNAADILNSYVLGATRIEAYSKEGVKLTEFDLPEGVIASDIHVDIYGHNRIYITDVGVNEQVVIYGANVSGKPPKILKTLGQKGGVFAGGNPGKVGLNRLFSPNAVAVGPNLNIFVNSRTGSWDGNTRFEKYAHSKALQWRRIALSFVDSASADPNKPQDMYLKTSRVVMDYDQPPGEQDSYWDYDAHTMNPHKYPDDPRWIHNLVWPEHKPTRTEVFYVNGQKFLLVTTATGGQTFAIFRFNPTTDGNIAIPTLIYSTKPLKATRSGRDFPRFEPRKGAYMWIDTDGDGQIDKNEYQNNPKGIFYKQTVDGEGNIWAVTPKGNIAYLPLQGISNRGVPQYDLNNQLFTYSTPAEIGHLASATYDSERDIMWVAGNKIACSYFGLEFGTVASIPDWRKGNEKVSFAIDLPTACGQHHRRAMPIAIDMAGEYIFVGYYNSTPGSEIQRNGHVRVYRRNDGSFIGHMEHFNYLKGDIDIFNGMQAVLEEDGTYVVILEEAMRPKQTVYRWKPEILFAD
ncbi:MAG: hypothetical protein AAFQ91_31175 [Cyanobacteria bacterium J06621_15]